MSQSSYFALFAGFLSATLLVAGVASADDELSEEEVEDEAEVESDMQRAQEAFDEGARYYYDGEYSSAIVEFRRANEIHEHPIFYHNIALSNRGLERPDRALDAALEADRMAEGLPEDTAATNSGLIAGYTSVETTREVADDVIADVEPARWGGLGWGGVATAVAGVGALTGAVVIDRQIAAGFEELNADDVEEQMGPDEFDDRHRQLESRQTTGRVLLFSGAGLALAGTSLIVWELMSGPDGSGGFAVSPTVDRPGLDVLVRW